MKLRTPLLVLAIAVMVSFAIVQLSNPVSYVDQLIRIQADEELGHIDRAILNEPIPIQATLLDYSSDKELVLKAWIALHKYPEKARNILLTYGSQSTFMEILKNYGDAIIPPIDYFLQNDVWSVKAMDSVGGLVNKGTAFVNDLWNDITGSAQARASPGVQTQTRVLGPEERGWYAVNYIKKEGHDFLGQFVVDKDKRVKWNQTARVTNAISSLFTSGVRALETKYDLGDDVTPGDVFFAGLDVVPMAVSLKLLRAGKVVKQSGKELSFTTRTRLFAPRLISRSPILQGMGKYGAAVAIGYIVVSHPSLINSLFDELAKSLGVSSWLVQFVGWILIIILIFYPFLWLLISLTQFLLWGFSLLKRI